MSFLRKIFGIFAKETPLNSVKRIVTSKLPIPDVGGEYYIRFTAKKIAGVWVFGCDTNCKFECNGKTKSMEAFRRAKKKHLNSNGVANYLEDVILLLADLENSHLRYSTSVSPIKQDNKTRKYHYIHVLDKMPDEMQDSISRRWDAYLEKFGSDNILPPKEVSTSKPKRSLPARKTGNNKHGHNH